ncbi:MAG: flagellar basal body rod protein FlgC [Candidatus Eisenbacteria sp.]|nr:flagellar basal body rod protein FlgC [Candidatus Eisenbacteria bacterium]
MSEELFAPLAISASGLSAQRKRMETIARNIANADATRSEEGGAYKRQRVVMSSTDSHEAASRATSSHRVSLRQTSPMHLGGGAGRRSQELMLPKVEAEAVVDTDAGYRLVHDPTHPDADEEGYVRLPDINAVTEMVDMMAATRAYEANLAAMRAYKAMVAKSLEI